MIFVFVLSALAGAVITFSALWPLGVVVALIGTPFGGSLLALGVAVALAARDSDAAKASPRRVRA
jgi:hypothetical protein